MFDVASHSIVLDSPRASRTRISLTGKVCPLRDSVNGPQKEKEKEDYIVSVNVAGEGFRADWRCGGAWGRHSIWRPGQGRMRESIASHMSEAVVMRTI